jgi:hypothetical protein
LTSSTSARKSDNPDVAVLAPLLELIDDGARPRIEERPDAPKFNSKGRKRLVQEIVSEARRRGGTVRCMIALLPDPVRTSASQDFDSHLDGIQGAAAAAGLVTAHFRFPWSEADRFDQSASEKAPDAELNSRLAEKARGTRCTDAGAELSHTDTGTAWAPCLDDQPGLLVFRKGSNFLAMFLVLETPKRGLKKHQLTWSLDLLDAFADAEQGEKESASPRSFCILGPRYTGTQSSLNHAIDGWLTHTLRERLPGAPAIAPVYWRSHTFSIAASASDIDPKGLKTLRSVEKEQVKHPSQAMRQNIVYRSASNRRADMIKCNLRTFLDSQFGKRKTALLLESNTGWGHKLAERLSDNVKEDPWIDLYRYPLHIGSLRAIYEKQGLLRDPGAAVFHSAGHLELAPEEGERRRDVVAPATPEFSTRVDELIMVQTMTEIARGVSAGEYNSVVIAGTSSLDIIFLAKLVRKFAPNAVIIATMSDLLFTQPQTISDLRGMIVLSSYPLYPPNRRWSYPYGKGAGVFFNHEGGQAIYNATMCLLAEVFDDDAELKEDALPLEFSGPFQREVKNHRPSVWISVVGNRGIYPLSVESPHDEPPTGSDRWPALPDAGMSTRPFQPPYHTIWKALEGLLLLLGSAMFCLAGLELWWAMARRNRWDLSQWRIWRILHRLASFLVWSRDWNAARGAHSAEAPRSSSGHGTGVLLILAQLTFLLVYVTVNRPFLFPWPAGWIEVDRWLVLSWVGFGLALASLALSLGSWLLLTAGKRAVVSLALIAATLIVGVFLLYHQRLQPLYGSPTETYLALERIVAVTSGVSPTFPVVFVGFGAAALIVAQLKRRYLNEQFSIKRLAPQSQSQSQSHSDPQVARADPLLDVERKIDNLRDVLHKPLHVFRLGYLIPTFLLAVYISSFVTLGLWEGFGVSLGEGWLFGWVFWTFFGVLSVYLAFQVYIVFVVWSYLKQILAQVSRLPLARSFERLPTRVARWFFETPTPRSRSVMIADQATALAERCGPSPVRTALERMCSPVGTSSAGVSQAEWDALAARLRQINEPVTVTGTTDEAIQRWRTVTARLTRIRRCAIDPGAYVRLSSRAPILALRDGSGETGQAQGQSVDREECTLTGATSTSTSTDTSPNGTAMERPRTEHSGTGPSHSDSEPTVIPEANEILKKVLRRVWEGLPLTWTFAEGKVAEKLQEEAAAGWPIAPKNAVALAGEANDGETGVVAGVRQWTEMAEDLIALQLLRHLSQFLAQIWVMVGFIVVASFTLLLAISSYPFPLEDRIEFLLAILISVAALAILRLVVGINRDETISRVASTVGGLKLDRNLFSGVVTYILPLIGILAAVSYDVSDLLRVWLDPVFRILR